MSTLFSSLRFELMLIILFLWGGGEQSTVNNGKYGVKSHNKLILAGSVDLAVKSE